MRSAPDVADGVWLGIDVGTQSVRVLAVTSKGRSVGSGRQPLCSNRDGVRHEQHPEQWWAAVSSAAAEAMTTVPPGSVRGVAVDATSGTVLLTDDDGTALTPALMYDDARAAGHAAQVNDAGNQVWAELGYQRMQPSWALPKLLWLLREHPAAGPAAHLTHQSDFVNHRLTGHRVPADLSNALKSGAHLVDETWPHDVMERLGVPVGLLPELVRSGTPIGTVGQAAAGSTGIPEGTPVIAGATDGCAAQLGAGVLRAGSWNSVLGTTLVLKGVTHDLVHDRSGVVYSHKAPNGDWLPGGGSSTGAGVVSRDFGGFDLGELTVQARTHEPSSAVTYPLTSDGERFPFADQRARGFALGSSLSDADRFASVLQGVGYVERLCFDYLDMLGASSDGDLVLTGGATKNAYWSQLRADILGRPVILRENAEPALGVAILAAGVGREASTVAAEMVRTSQTIDPRPGADQRFAGPYLRFVDELEQRGWLDRDIATHAKERIAR